MGVDGRWSWKNIGHMAWFYWLLIHCVYIISSLISIYAYVHFGDDYKCLKKVEKVRQMLSNFLSRGYCTRFAIVFGISFEFVFRSVKWQCGWIVLIVCKVAKKMMCKRYVFGGVG